MSPAKKAAVCLRHTALCALASVPLLASPRASAYTPPTISGTPSPTAIVSSAYSFRPTAHDYNGVPMKFGVSDKPAWLSFNATTGRLYGTPTAANVGKYSNIDIWVSDGYRRAFLPAFSITVSSAAQLPTAAVTVTWTPPTENTNGSTLTNLAGYRIYYGTSQSNLDHVVVLTNPGLASYVLSSLSAGTWYLALTSVNTAGVEGPRSTVVSAVVQ